MSQQARWTLEAAPRSLSRRAPQWFAYTLQIIPPEPICLSGRLPGET